jgi:hypothetical protein
MSDDLSQLRSIAERQAVQLKEQDTELEQAKAMLAAYRRALEVAQRDTSSSYVRHFVQGVLHHSNAGAALLADLARLRRIEVAARGYQRAVKRTDGIQAAEAALFVALEEPDL